MIIALLLVIGLLLAPAAGADVGFESASRPAAAPGEEVRVTVGCGFCYPECVGRPGHRHPPGDLHGVCMLGGRGGPPKAFEIWLTAAGRSLGPYGCDPGLACVEGSSRPPHLPSFTYLGRATPEPARSRGPREVPRYVLRYRVPEVPPGPHKYVLFCDSCVPGPRGSLVDYGLGSSAQMTVLPADSEDGSGSGPWVVGGRAAAAIALSAVVLFLLRTRVIAISHP